MEPLGKVWITGAGPGDEELLTVKAEKVIGQADAIVYDALVSPEIMSIIPAHVQKINVGKRSSRHLVPQQEINEILAGLAKEGKNVVRLKGGDPFVFGRGGEELELLAKEGVSYEVIPGVTSAVSALAYAGIPVTHRDYTSSFHVITGHPKQGGNSRIDYKALVQLGGTLIFLMGVSSMREICENLILAGMNPDTPAAVVENGTTARQRQVAATVATLADKAEQEAIGTPAIIAVGEVCGLMEEFAWEDKRVLSGKRIVVTRPVRRMKQTASRLRSFGAHVIEYPVIDLKPVLTKEKLLKAVKQIHESERKEEWIVFTSPSGVEIFFEQMKLYRLDLRQLLSGNPEVKTAAIGSATAEVLREHGLLADLIPDAYTAADLGKTLCAAADADSHVTVFRAEKGSDLLLPPLLERGIPCDDTALYETAVQSDEDADQRVKEQVNRGGVDFVTFTSGSTVHAFAKKMEGTDYTAFTAACIGEQTADAARQYGMHVLTARQSDEEGLISLICENADM